MRLLVLILTITVLSDQVTKGWAHTQELVSFNPGISFGLGSLMPSWALTLLLTIFLVGIAWVGRSFWLKQPVVAGLFLGGALSNLIDRWLWGSVRDWLPIPLLNMTNNLADYALAIAVILIGYSLIRQHNHADTI